MFGKRLRALLESRNIRQVELATALNVTPAAVSRYVNGRVPSNETLFAIADYFGVTVDYLLGRNGTIGERVREFREAKGWNRKELAERAGLHNSLIGLIERGDRKAPRPDTLDKLAEAFGITAARLRGEKMEHHSPYEEVIEIARAYGVGPSELRELVELVGRIKGKRA